MPESNDGLRTPSAAIMVAAGGPSRFAARVIVDHQLKLFVAGIVLMVSVAGIQFAFNRFEFQDAYRYDLFVPSDPIVTQQEAAFQVSSRPAFQLPDVGLVAEHFTLVPLALTWHGARGHCDGAVWQPQQLPLPVGCRKVK